MGNIDEDGFAGGLMPEQVHVSKASTTVRSGNGPTPFLHAIRGARSVIIPELKREVLNMEMLKSIIEQEGALLTSRECRGNVTRWRPSALLVTIGNYCPDFGDTPPDGTERRVNVMSMSNRFGPRPDAEVSLLLGDFDLKAKINKGLYWNDFFHVSAAFYAFLSLYTDKVRRPAKIEADTAEALQRAYATADAPPWYLDVFTAADATHPAITSAEVRTMTRNALGLTRRVDATTELVKHGFRLDECVGGRRLAKFKFPGDAAASYVAKRM
jgi:hypothetical protein